MTKGSDAARAGMKRGDDIITLSGHPIVSIADVQFALDQAGNGGELAVRVKRGSRTLDLTLELPRDWRRRDQFAWRYSFNGVKSKVLGFDELSKLTDAERETRGIKATESAIRVGRVLRARRGSGFNTAARRIGMRPGDILLEVDSQGRTNESEMLAYVLQKKQPGDELRFRVWRDGRRFEFAFPVNGILKRRGHDH